MTLHVIGRGAHDLVHDWTRAPRPITCEVTVIRKNSRDELAYVYDINRHGVPMKLCDINTVCSQLKDGSPETEEKTSVPL